MTKQTLSRIVETVLLFLFFLMGACVTLLAVLGPPFLWMAP
jgi:hypothetical protein